MVHVAAIWLATRLVVAPRKSMARPFVKAAPNARSGAARCRTDLQLCAATINRSGVAGGHALSAARRFGRVGGHEILPVGGHGTARWWPRELPTGGQQICPR